MGATRLGHSGGCTNCSCTRPENQTSARRGKQRFCQSRSPEGTTFSWAQTTAGPEFGITARNASISLGVVELSPSSQSNQSALAWAME
jgi:hypothetical protein